MLRRELAALRRLDDRLRSEVKRITETLNAGVDWSGWAIWPEPLRPGLEWLHREGLALDHAAGRVRAVDAGRAVARLRDDVEELIRLLRQVIDLYVDGIVAAYRGEGGGPTLPSPTGRGVIAALYEQDAQRVLALRHQIQVLFRTTAYQAVEPVAAVEPQGRWAVYEWELALDRDEIGTVPFRP